MDDKFFLCEIIVYALNLSFNEKDSHPILVDTYVNTRTLNMFVRRTVSLRTDVLTSENV